MTNGEILFDVNTSRVLLTRNGKKVSLEFHNDLVTINNEGKEICHFCSPKRMQESLEKIGIKLSCGVCDIIIQSYFNHFK